MDSLAPVDRCNRPWLLSRLVGWLEKRQWVFAKERETHCYYYRPFFWLHNSAHFITTTEQLFSVVAPTAAAPTAVSISAGSKFAQIYSALLLLLKFTPLLLLLLLLVEDCSVVSHHSGDVINGRPQL